MTVCLQLIVPFKKFKAFTNNNTTNNNYQWYVYIKNISNRNLLMIANYWWYSLIIINNTFLKLKVTIHSSYQWYQLRVIIGSCARNRYSSLLPIFVVYICNNSIIVLLHNHHIKWIWRKKNCKLRKKKNKKYIFIIIGSSKRTVVEGGRRLRKKKFHIHTHTQHLPSQINIIVPRGCNSNLSYKKIIWGVCV